MGYDVHISRKSFWADEDDKQTISLLEWQNCIKHDPEIGPDPENQDQYNFLFLRKEGNWPLWFNPRLGEIYTKNPPPDVIAKMVRTAAMLGAKVCGDDDEEYGAGGAVIDAPQQRIAAGKPWWKFW